MNADGAHDVADAVLSAASEGQEELAAAATEGVADIDRSVRAEEQNLDAVAASEEAAVGRSFSSARGALQSAIRQSAAHLRHGALAEQARLHAWGASAHEQATSEFATKQEAVREIGERRADEAVSTANAQADEARSRIQGYAGEARRHGETKAAAARGPRPEVTQAKRAAAREIAGDSSSKITDSLSDTMEQIRSVGPEARPQFVEQANQIAGQLGEALPQITAQISATEGAAADSVASAAATGRRSLDELGVSITIRLARLEASVRASLRQQSQVSKLALSGAGQQAAEAVHQQHGAAAQAGADLVATLLGSVGNRRMRRATAQRLSSELGQQVRSGFRSTGQRARLAAAQVAQTFAQAAVECQAAIQTTAAQSQEQTSGVAEEARSLSAQQKDQLLGQVLEMVTAAITSGDTVVTGAVASLDRTLADVNARFGSAIVDLHTQLQGKVNEAAENARKPLDDIDERISEAMSRAEERMDQSWFERQLSEAWEGINWGFVAGLVVGILVTILVIALIGTGIGALILAGALAGALSVAASTLAENAIHDRPTDWFRLGRDMLIGAAFGAIGGAIGGGITAALARGVSSAVISEAAVITISKASNLAIGTVLGVVQNAVNGDPWDRGLLLNIGAAVATTYGPGARAIESLNARAAAYHETQAAPAAAPVEVAAEARPSAWGAEAAPAAAPEPAGPSAPEAMAPEAAPAEAAPPAEAPPAPEVTTPELAPAPEPAAEATPRGEAAAEAAPPAAERPRATEPSPAGPEPVREGAPAAEAPSAAAEPAAPGEAPATAEGPAERTTIEEIIDQMPDETVMQPADGRDGASARQMYENSIAESPTREAAIYRNTETGEYIVVQGDESTASVGGGEGPGPAGRAQRWKELLDGRDLGRWELEAHSHPVEAGTGVVDPINQMPSGGQGDMGVLANESRAAGGQPRSSRIDYTTRQGPEHTDFGFDPAHEQPYWVDVPDGQGGRQVTRFRSLEAYHEYFSDTFGVDLGSVPPDLSGSAPATAVAGAAEAAAASERAAGEATTAHPAAGERAAATGEAPATAPGVPEQGGLIDASTPTRYHVYDPANRRFSAFGYVEDGELRIDLRSELPDGQQSQLIRGHEQFQRILSHLSGYDGIRGNWSYGTNLQKFNELTGAGIRPEEAALRTWTGQQAQAVGFGRVVVRRLYGSPGTYDKVEVSFLRE